MKPKDDAPFSTVAALRENAEESATRALAALLEHDDSVVRLEAARALCSRRLPNDVRAQIAAQLHLPPESVAPGQDEQLLRWVYACGAKAALEQPPERAFAELAPLLEVNMLGPVPGHVRARKILEQLEETLSTCWKSGVHPHPDGRFVAVAESIRDNPTDASLRYVAQLVIDAFRCLEGTGAEPGIKHVELGEDGDVPFPFLVVGFMAPNEDAVAALARDLPAPAGLCVFDHPYGGSSRGHETCLGYGVSVPPAIQEPVALRRLRESWSKSGGAPMPEAELERWRDALGGPGNFPALERGNEALLVSRECEPLMFLRGAPVLAFGRAHAPWRTRVDLSAEADVTPAGPFTEAHSAALSRLGEMLQMGRPRIAYLWGNSD